MTDLVVVRGAGDLATGTIQKLAHAGFRVLALETAEPLAIRWRAALSTAVREGSWTVEDLTGVRVGSLAEADAVWRARPEGGVPVLVDPDAAVVAQARPAALVDAILAKRNVGTHRGMAPVTVGLGPGFTAGDDVDFVVETMRGHDLGRVIDEGSALPNTGVPGLIAGRAAERVLHAPASGVLTVVRGIGSVVAEGEVLATIAAEGGVIDQAARPAEADRPGAGARDQGQGVDVRSAIAGVVRGMIADGTRVPQGLKIADVDPRAELAAVVDTISDKARSVGGGALDAVLQGLRRRSPAAPARP